MTPKKNLCSKAATANYNIFFITIASLINQKSNLLQNQTKTRACICSHPSYLPVEYTVPGTACLSVSQCTRHMSYSALRSSGSFEYIIHLLDYWLNCPEIWDGKNDQHATTRPAQKMLFRTKINCTKHTLRPLLKTYRFSFNHLLRCCSSFRMLHHGCTRKTYNCPYPN